MATITAPDVECHSKIATQAHISILGTILLLQPPADTQTHLSDHPPEHHGYGATGWDLWKERTDNLTLLISRRICILHTKHEEEEYIH